MAAALQKVPSNRWSGHVSIKPVCVGLQSMLKQSRMSVLPFSATIGTISGLIFVPLPGNISGRNCHWQLKFPGSAVAHAQAFHHDRRTIARANISDDSTHGKSLLWIEQSICTVAWVPCRPAGHRTARRHPLWTSCCSRRVCHPASAQLKRAADRAGVTHPLGAFQVRRRGLRRTLCVRARSLRARKHNPRPLGNNRGAAAAR